MFQTTNQLQTLKEVQFLLPPHRLPQNLGLSLQWEDAILVSSNLGSGTTDPGIVLVQHIQTNNP